MQSDLRRPPSYQEYAADIRSLPTYLMMTNDERAVFHGLRLACWVADEVPTNTATLARILLMPEADLVRGFTARVRDLFAPVVGRPDHLHSPELDAQMQRMVERRRERSETGRRGAEAKHRGSASGLANDSDNGSADGSAKPAGNGAADGSLSRAGQSRAETNPSLDKAEGKTRVADDPFVQAYTSHEANADRLIIRAGALPLPKPSPKPRKPAAAAKGAE